MVFMEISVIFDHVHNLWLHKIPDSPEKQNKEIYNLPSLKLSKIRKEKAFYCGYQTNEGDKFHFIVIKNKEKPQFKEFLIDQHTDPHEWIPMSSVKKMEFLQCSGELLLEMYSKIFLDGFSLKDREFDVWHFEISEDSANHLAELTWDETKRGTASLLESYKQEGEPIPAIGNFSIILAWDGFPCLIIETSQVDIVPYKDVTEEFAAWEGEGDKSLKYWRDVHQKFFTLDAQSYGGIFTEMNLIICERFLVKKRLRLPNDREFLPPWPQ